MTVVRSLKDAGLRPHKALIMILGLAKFCQLCKAACQVFIPSQRTNRCACHRLKLAIVQRAGCQHGERPIACWLGPHCLRAFQQQLRLRIFQQALILLLSQGTIQQGMPPQKMLMLALQRHQCVDLMGSEHHSMRPHRLEARLQQRLLNRLGPVQLPQVDVYYARQAARHLVPLAVPVPA
jgi:hypothetical protein